MSRPIQTTCLCLAATVVAMLLPTMATAQTKQSQWIWAPEHTKDSVPEGSCFFRKKINISQMTRAEVTVAADDEFELWINGKKATSGQNWNNPKKVDVSKLLKVGDDNVFAFQVKNTRGMSAGLLAEIAIFGDGNASARFPSDETWKVSLSPFPFWQTSFYRDSGWDAAKVLGPVGTTSPWITESAQVASKKPKASSKTLSNGAPVPPAEVQKKIEAITASTKSPPQATMAPVVKEQSVEQPEDSRFRILPGFAIQEVISAEKTGGLLCLTFNEFGNILAAKEGGDLLLIHDTNDDGVVDSVRSYNKTVKNVQGILPLNGDVFVVGEGSEGTGLYKLSDTDRDGYLEEVNTLITFEGPIGEHGPHGLALGPDGLIYMITGNDARMKNEIAPTSPHKHFYEGDLVPRFEDPGGHATGTKAPGGVVVRTDIEGETVEIVAGGTRNAYDLTFNRAGDLFIHDSDMEWDEGLVWHRPTRLYRVTPGADYGWRSGWAKWPDYYPDAAAPMLDTGAGSPTGLVVYDHFKFPSKFQNRLLVTDWSNGKINTVEMKRKGAGYEAKMEPLLEGNPMNVTDLEVGPDGWVYFATGGRGTEGGLFRIVWKGEVENDLENLGEGIAKAIRQPQASTAWARQRIAEVQAELGDDWNRQIQGVAIAGANPAHYRTRALDLMQLYGPTPTLPMLLKLTEDGDERVCGKAVSLLVNYPDLESEERLKELLQHRSADIRRRACEVLAEIDGKVSFDDLRDLLVSDDPHESFAARRLLEEQPTEDWLGDAIADKSPRLFNVCSIAALIAQPSQDTAIKIAKSAQGRLDSYLADQDFLELLRVIQLAIHRGELTNDDLPELADRIAVEFPAGDQFMNRELIRTLAYFRVSTITDRYIAHLDTDMEEAERLNLAMHMSFIREGWTTKQKLKLLGHLENGLNIQGGEGLRGYVETSTKEFVECLTPKEQYLTLSMGHLWPNAALAVLFKLPDSPSDDVLRVLRQVDHALAGKDTAVVNRLRKGIVALLAQNGSDENMAYLRKAFQSEPERRESIAFGLSQQPYGDNYDLLVEAVPVLDGQFATAIVKKMASVPKSVDDPESIRQLILLGLRLDNDGQHAVTKLLRVWVGSDAARPSDSVEDKLKSWQKWFADNHPSYPAAQLADQESSNWDLDEVLEYLADADYQGGDAINGKALFKKTQCAACHRFESVGEAIGPDLTEIARRFQKKQILESILFPSQVISAHYRARNVLTIEGKSYSGLLMKTPSGDYVIIDNRGERIQIAKDDVEEVATSKVSVMPSGLVDQLTAEEIGDLMTYLGVNKSKSTEQIAEKSDTSNR